MKSYIKPVILGIIFLVLAIFIFERACPRSDAKYQKLRGELAEAQKQLKKNKDLLSLRIKVSDKINEGLEIEVKDLKEKNKKLDKEILASKKRDEERAQAIYDIKKEGETLTDPVAIIANRDLLIEQWEARFWNERAEKEKVEKQRNFWASIAFKQHYKYLGEHSIRKGLEKQLSAEEAYDNLAGETINEGDKVIKGLSFKLNFKNILYSTTFFGLGYLLGATT